MKEKNGESDSENKINKDDSTDEEENATKKAKDKKKTGKTTAGKNTEKGKK